MIGARADTRAPAALDSPEARAAYERARSFFERPAKERAQETFSFDEAPLADAGVRTALWGTCTGKCAYCETPLTEQAMLIDRFRPAQGALALDGSLSPDHYWWLAYAWENLYPTCAECQSFKGARFPVREQRALPGTTGDALRSDRPLLLEPRCDDPEQHLVYADDGSVASTTEEGRTTIEILGLNRAPLGAQRREALAQARSEWDSMSSQMATKAGLDAVAFDRLFDRGLPFSALRRQFLNTWTQGRRNEIDQALQSTSEGPSSVPEVAGNLPVVTATERSRVKGVFDRTQRGLRVDQLLTSEHFGLNSTIDPTLDALFAEYYLLKAKPHPTAADNRRREELATQLDGLDVLGSTRRERIVLEAADDYLAKAGTLADPTERLELRESTKKRIAAIWEKASTGRAVR